MSDDFIITPVTVPTVTVKLDDPNATISTVEEDGAVFDYEASAPTPTEPSDDTLAEELVRTEPANHTVTYPTGPIDPEDVFI